MKDTDYDREGFPWWALWWCVICLALAVLGLCL